MAYVLWRVFMKKYAKVRLGIHRNALPSIPKNYQDNEQLVTPTGRHVRSFDESSWKITDEHALTLSSTVTPATTCPNKSVDESISSKQSSAATIGSDFNRGVETRKSKTKRVKNYLKKCKDAALKIGSTDKSSTVEDDNDTKSMQCTTKQQSSSSLWYVDNSKETPVCTIESGSSVINYVTIDNDIWETVEELQPYCTDNFLEEFEQTEILKTPKQNVDNNNKEETEFLKESSVDKEEINSVFESVDELTLTKSCDTDIEVTKSDETSVNETESKAEVVSTKCDVAGLVDSLFGPLYPNYKQTRGVLIRQARDLLVCEFMGNMSRFESEFCIPAATLIAAVKYQAQNGNKSNPSSTNELSSSCQLSLCCAPSGWPLSIGPSSICLHLSPLEPSLLRNGDCYLCVRNRSAPGLEVALIWRSHQTIGSYTLAAYQYPLKNDPIHIDYQCDFQSMASIEMEITNEGDQNLPELLENLLVSVEHTIERIPLDDLSFPCPQCHQYIPLSEQSISSGSLLPSSNSIDSTNNTATNNSSVCVCQCSCQMEHNHNTQTVNRKDSSIQTCPMLDIASSIPHIDSDDDPEESAKKQATNCDDVLDNVKNDSKKNEFSVPKYITDLPEKLFMSGIYLPGTKDKEDRPLIVCDSASIARAGISRYDVIKLLLYYTSISGKCKQENGFTIVVLSETSEEAALDVLDKTLATLINRIKISHFIIWRINESKKTTVQKTLKSSKLKCTIITDSEFLIDTYITKENLPINDDGIQTHDQLEWFEFFKEFEPFYYQCYGNGRMLAAAMAEIRNDNLPSSTSQSTKRHLNHQHRQLMRSLSNPDLVTLRRDGGRTLEHLEERAQWLTASEDVQVAKIKARRCFEEIQRVINRLELLADQRRERIKELIRLRALEEETVQMLKWFKETGNEKLTHINQMIHNTEVNQEILRKREQEFEEFYFIAVKYMDRTTDLLDEAEKCIEPVRNNIFELANNLKQQMCTFNEILEETREYLENILKYFQILERLKTCDQQLQRDNCISEMFKIANKLKNEALIEKCMTLSNNLLETIPTNMITNELEIDNGNVLATSTPIQENKQIHTGSSGGRRQSISSFAYIYRCNHHAAGFPCDCWAGDYDENNSSTISQKLKNSFLQSLQQQTTSETFNNNNCVCRENIGRQNALGLCNIKEVRESTENLSTDQQQLDKNTDSGLSGCGKCDDSRVNYRNKITRNLVNRNKRDILINGSQMGHHRIHRTCSCQYLNNSSESCGICSIAGSTTTSGSGSNGGDQPGDNMTEGGSEGFAAKSNTSEELEDSEEQFRSKTIPPVTVNSHLYCHSSSAHLPSVISTLDSKTQKTLHLIMHEMIQTERDYVKSLDYIIENYIPELTREDIPQALRGQRNVVFGNVEKIFEFHSQHFLHELEDCADNPLQVGQCFLRHEKKFYLYALYNKNKPKSDSLMSEYGTAFFKSKQLELEDKMDLASYLLKPVQRMGKYALLLQQLMKACPQLLQLASTTVANGNENSDFENLRAAEQMVRFQLRHGNDLLAMDSLRDCDVNLKEQGRLLRQNEFLVGEGRGGKKHIRQVFLFEELILFSKANRFPDRKNLDLYIYKNSIKMTDIGLTERIGDSTTKFEIWYRKRKRNDTFVLQAMSEEVKKAWTEEISTLLWKQAMRNREVRLQEMSSMGIGNKPCLDIRPSEDQISDRSISIAQLSKTPKFRNSIAGPITETCRSSKRPQSIISVSSSLSSSGSTTSSGGGGGISGNSGTLNGCRSHYRHHNHHCNHNSNSSSFCNDASISPKTHHRSTLNSQCSAESGILVDYSITSDDCCNEVTLPHNNNCSLLQKSNSQYSTLSLPIKSSINNSSQPVITTPEDESSPQVTLYHVPDDLSINL